MKSKDNNLDNNISRLVKLAGDSNEPTKAFTDSVIEGALDELSGADKGREREEKDRTMKSNWTKVLSWAAVIVVVCGIGFGILVLSPQGEALSPGKVVGTTDQSSQWAEVKPEDSTRSVIEYTEGYVNTKAGEKESAKSLVSQGVSEEAKKSVLRDENRIVRVTPESPSALPSELQLSSERKRMSVGTPRSSRSGPGDKSGVYGSYDVSRLEPRPKVPVLGDEPIIGRPFNNRSSVAGEVPHYLTKGVEPKRYGRLPMAHGGSVPPNGEDVDGMFFKNYGVNPFIDTEDDHLSTFATDVDTGSYTVVRGYLHDGHLPPSEAVRVEEFVNYFKYGYSAPQEDDFAIYAEAAPWKFGDGRKNAYLLRLGLKTKQVSDANRKPAVLTFVIDVSGSMNRENRLGLVKRCLRMLIERLRPEDRIGIAVYNTRGRKVMCHRGLDERDEILAAIERLRAGGSTNAEEGIRIGYEMADAAYRKGYINRVILCSDGVANVGETGADGILEVIKQKAEKGVTLSAIGFGMGNYNDVLLEQLGDKGNGNYTYIDTIAEAKRIFEGNLAGALQVVARDAKVQVDFNPDVVRSYRLIGYENRDVPDDKFRDDKYDGGEIGAGHSVTALYELKLRPDKKGTVATTYVRYKDAETRAVTEFKSSIGTNDFNTSLDDSSSDFRLAATAAEFAEILRKSYWAKGATLDTVLERAGQLSEEFKGDADVIELVDLISKAKRLMRTPEQPRPIEYEEGPELLIEQ